MSKPTGTATKTKKPSVSIQTNATSKAGPASSSPSSAAKRLPGSTQTQAVPATNGASTNGVARPNRRVQRLSTRMSTSDNATLEKKAAWTPEPYVSTEKHMLTKYKGKPPSLIVHLYPNYFRFDQQEGSFAYRSEMRPFIEHLKKKTVPHDMLEELRKDNVRFYEGWLIVRVVDHTSSAAEATGTHGAGNDDKPFSIHNYNHFITPSPCAPYPTREQQNQSPPVKMERSGSTEKENVAPDSGDATTKPGKPQPRAYHVALRPTQLSKHVDLMLDCTAPDPKAKKPQKPAQPPTPVGTVPSTPSTERPPPPKRMKLRIDPKDHLEYEARVVNATAPPLYLEPAADLEDMDRIHKMLADPLCQEAPPSPRSRKRTVAELAAEDRHAKEQERFMLVMDARGSGTAATNAAGVDAQAGNVAFQPRFERFNALDNIRREINEKKQRENEERVHMDELRRSQQQQRHEEEQKRQANQAAIAQRKEQAILRQQQQQQQQNQMQMQQQRQNQEAMAAQQNAQLAQRRNTAQQQPNGIPPQMQNQIMQQVSSPIIRQGTPNAASSPATANGRPMVRNGSQAGAAASPPRPASSLQHAHPAAAGMMRQPSNQGAPSRNGTPQIPHSTPGMPNATPIMRQNTPSHTMTQASPMVSMAMPTPPMGQTQMQQQMSNGMHPGMTPQQMAAMQHRRQQMQQAQMNGQQMNPQMAQHMAQQQAQAQQAALRRQAEAQGTPQPQHMSPVPQQTQNYNAQLRRQMMAQMPNQGSPGPNQMSQQQMQQMQMQQLQAQQAMQAGQQGQQSNGQPQQRPTAAQNVLNQLTMQYFKQLMTQESQNFNGNPNMIPAGLKQQLQLNAQKQAVAHMRQRAMAQNQQMQNGMMQGQNNQMMNMGQMQMGNNMNPNMAAMQQQNVQARQMQQQHIQMAQQQMAMQQMMMNNQGQQGPR